MCVIGANGLLALSHLHTALGAPSWGRVDVLASGLYSYHCMPEQSSPLAAPILTRSIGAQPVVSPVTHACHITAAASRKLAGGICRTKARQA